MNNHHKIPFTRRLSPLILILSIGLSIAGASFPFIVITS